MGNTRRWCIHDIFLPGILRKARAYTSSGHVGRSVPRSNRTPPPHPSPRSLRSPLLSIGGRQQRLEGSGWREVNPSGGRACWGCWWVPHLAPSVRRALLTNGVWASRTGSSFAHRRRFLGSSPFFVSLTLTLPTLAFHFLPYTALGAALPLTPGALFWFHLLPCLLQTWVS